VTESNERADGRRELLLRMYDQLFNDINRHILVVWQSVATLLGSVAVFALVEKELIGVPVATLIIFLATGWLIANVIDSSYWYNRNLVIIANIEREFLYQSDLHDIHYYFGEHRASNTLLTHLWIQGVLGGLLALGVGLADIWVSMRPTFDASLHVRLWNAVPLLFAVVAAVVLYVFYSSRGAAYVLFKQNSPGVPIDTSGIVYGSGHPAETAHGRFLTVARWTTAAVILAALVFDLMYVFGVF